MKPDGKFQRSIHSTRQQWLLLGAIETFFLGQPRLSCTQTLSRILFDLCLFTRVITSAKEDNYVAHSLLFVCLSVSVSNFAQKIPNGFGEIFREGWQLVSKQRVEFW